MGLVLGGLTAHGTAAETQPAVAQDEAGDRERFDAIAERYAAGEAGVDRNAMFTLGLGLLLAGGEDLAPVHAALARMARDTKSDGADAWASRLASVTSCYVQGLRARGELAQADQAAAATLTEIGRDGYPGNATLLATRADVLRELDRWSEAIDILERDVPALMRDPDDYPAEPTREQSYTRAYAEYDAEYVEAIRRGVLAACRTALGATDQARADIRIETKLAKKLGVPSLLLSSLLHECDRLAALDRFDRIRGKLEDAREAPWFGHPDVPRESWALVDVWDAWIVAEEELDGRGEAGAALPGIEAVLATGMVPGRIAGNLRLLSLDLALAAGDLDEARAMIAGLEEELSSAEATLGTAEARAYFRALLVELEPDEPARVDALVAAYEELLALWDSAPQREGGIGFLHLDRRCRVIATLVGALEPEAALEVLLRAQMRGTLARRLGYGELTLDGLKRLLVGPDHGILILVPTIRGSRMVLLDAAGVAVHPLPPKSRLTAPLEAVAELFATDLTFVLGDPAERARLDIAIRAELTTLREQLLPVDGAALERVLGWKAITVVGFELLGGDAPFEALPLPDGRLLGQALAVDSTPSLPLYAEVARVPEGPELDLYVFGNLAPDLPEDLRDLVRADDFGRDEARRMAAPYAADRTRTRYGDHLTPSELFDETLGRAGTAHLWAHGRYDGSREKGAAMVLSHDDDHADGHVFSEHVHGVRPGALVILSSCGTARGPARYGDDVLTHLGGAFLEAGARAVVLSSADVEYLPHLDLMERAHRHLAAGASPAEAMRAARAERAALRETDGYAELQDARVLVLGAGQVGGR